MPERIENADLLEVFEGFEKDQLEGLNWDVSTTAALQMGLENAFGYRGDVTLHLKDGSLVEGYVFDYQPAPLLANSKVRVMLKASPGTKKTVPADQIAGLLFSGRDTAAGKSWEAWVNKYAEKKARGETNISLEPESLD
jgi:hypothetical protein